MKGQLPLTLLLVSVGFVTVSSSSVQKSNEFLDSLLGRFLQGEGATFQLEAVSAPDFNVTVAKNRFSNRDFKARFTNGRVKGLTRLKRKGDCQPTKWMAGNITLECTLDLSPVVVAYAVMAKGHTLSGREDPMDVYVRVRDGRATFEAHSFPNRPPAIKTFVVAQDLRSTVSVAPDPELNGARRHSFEDLVRAHSDAAIRDAVEKHFATASQESLKEAFLPPV